MLSLKSISNKKLFSLSILVGVIVVLVVAVIMQWQTVPRLKTNSLVENISVTEQLTLDNVRRLSSNNFKTIIDLRPDGEAPDQPASVEVEALAKANKINFVYVPVPHGDIPDSAVNALAKALTESPEPILMYCRSGKRAARTWSLVEASRIGGLDADAILNAVQRSGQSADDLKSAIERRIAKRKEGVSQ